MHIENDKLLIRGAAPNQMVKNEVWNAIKAIDAAYADLTADITIDPNLPAPPEPAAAKAAPAAASPTAAVKIYEVVSGDSLSKIAKQFYGDAGKYMKIFDANKDQLKDPNKIDVGQKLKIPE